LTGDIPIRVARVVNRTSAEGPGLRFAVWVQGCSIHCPGCFNAHLWSRAGGTEISATELAKMAIVADVEGVTLLGGEPFEQAAGLAMFSGIVRDAGLSVMAFTGYDLRKLVSLSQDDPAIAALLDETDLLLDGPFVQTLPDTWRPWVGSVNQSFHFLTDRYAHLANSLSSLSDRLEIRIAPDGVTSVNGWASVDQLDALLISDGYLLHPVERHED
jgi:anaerobic ribonucleoside-triphosphate reductase activating protein